MNDVKYVVKHSLPDINLLHTTIRLENLNAYTPYEVMFTVVLFEGMVALQVALALCTVETVRL